jgi:hypothetical protein
MDARRKLQGSMKSMSVSDALRLSARTQSSGTYLVPFHWLGMCYHKPDAIHWFEPKTSQLAKRIGES